MWLRRMASRRSTSMAAVASWPAVDLALDDPDDVAVQARQRVGGVEHLGAAGVGADRAGVADLAAGLGVERRAVEEDDDAAVAGSSTTASTRRLRLELLAPDELGRPELLEHLLERREVGVGVDPLGAGVRDLLGPARCSAIAASKPAVVDRRRRARRRSPAVTSSGKP